MPATLTPAWNAVLLCRAFDGDEVAIMPFGVSDWWEIRKGVPALVSSGRARILTGCVAAARNVADCYCVTSVWQ